jgi:AcrR family transcriptional regulator
MVILQLESQRLLALPIVRLSATYVNSCWPTIVDMRRTSQDTKAAILAAARERFGTAGFQAATIRAIAADAGIDPSMVMRYFGSKDQLFAAVAEFDLRFPDFTAIDRAQVGRSLVSHFLDRWEGSEDGDALVILLRSSATNDDAAQRMQQIFSAQLQPLVESLVPATDALEGAESGRRAGLIATQILGVAWCRFVLQLPPVVTMTRAEIVDSVGPTIQRYLGLPESVCG